MVEKAYKKVRVFSSRWSFLNNFSLERLWNNQNKSIAALISSLHVIFPRHPEPGITVMCGPTIIIYTPEDMIWLAFVVDRA